MRRPLCSVLLSATLLSAALLADDGTWLPNQFPAAAVKEKYNFEVTPEFLNHLRLASVRIAGGSGAFVSDRGLLVTNQHLVRSCLLALSRLKDGFYAESPAQEPRCPGLAAEVLISLEDVTAQVRGSASQSVAQRNATISRIEQECAARMDKGAHGRCSVVTLFSGARYDLYRYKTYEDLRLVFAPEDDLALFGRERDSITYLRYGLDAAFLRAYENGQPAATPEYLKWSREGVKEGGLVFTMGNPAPTMRLATSAQLAFYRDTALPLAVSRLQARVKQLGKFTGDPAFRALLTEFKTKAGMLIGLRDDRLVARKTNFEGKIRRAVLADAKLGAEANKVWDDIASAYKNWTPYEKAYQILEEEPAPGSALFPAARRMVRGEPPDVAATPPNPTLEAGLIAQYLDELKGLGEKEAPLKPVLNGRSSEEAAEAMVRSKDELLRLAQALEEPAKRLRKRRDELIGALETSAAEKIAQYRFKLFGAADYPDANGTPRVAFGVVKGYTDRAGVPMPFASSFGGLYYRHDNQGPYQVPQRWVDRKAQIDLSTALDFVSTCDIGGGDPGSPAVNRAGELVGVTFDGNLESLPDIYLYSDEQARAVHVAADGIVESLRKVYKTDALLKELGQ